MTSSIHVRAWVRATDAEIRTGLLGFICIELDGLLIDSIVLRRTSDGRFTLSFPSRTAKNGQRHAIVRPVDDGARREIERVILAQLGQRDDLGGATEDQP